MWYKTLNGKLALVVCLLVFCSAFTRVSVAKYLYGSDKVVDARWVANTMPVNASVSCGEIITHKVWPEMECKATVWLGLPTNIVYNSVARNERVRALRLRYFRLDTQHKKYYLESDKEYFDMGKVDYIVKPNQAPNETILWLGNYDYKLDGFNEYISSQADEKLSEIRVKIYFKRLLVIIFASIIFAASLFGVKILCNKIYTIARRVANRITLIPRKFTKWNTERQISKIALHESVSLSVRNAYENMESEEIHVLRKEIGKALENNETELAKKLSRILIDIEKKKDKS